MKTRWTFGRGYSRLFSVGVAASCVLLMASQGLAQNRITYAQQPDGTWNLLELFQPSPGLTYADAVTAAQTAGGHLFTPRSRMENAAGASLGEAWIGLDDTDGGTGEGNWSLVDDGSGREVIWTGLGSDAGGMPVTGKYHNWNGGGEPNDAGGEDAAVILPTGRWNDLPDNDATVTRNYIVEYDSGLASQPDPAPGLPQATANAWNIRRIDGMPNIENVRAVEMALYSNLGTTADYTAPEINFLDQNSGDGLMAFGTPFPGDDAGNADENNFAIYARARVRIDEAGDYTFGFSGDDGSELRIHGQNFTSSTNLGDGGNVNLAESNLPAVAHDGDRIAYPNPTGNGLVLGVVNLTPGEYDVTYTWYENGGGAHSEVFAAPGAHSTFDPTVFRPVGHQAVEGRQEVFLGVTEAGWQVSTTAPGGSQLTTLAEAFAEFTAEAPTQIQHDVINFGDPQTNNPGGRFGGDVPFDNDTAADDDDFMVFATATLSVPVDGTYRLGFQSDDGAELGFFDTTVTFSSLLQNATGGSVIGQGVFGGGGQNVITADVLTGDSSTVGEVFLTAGDYDIYTMFWERAGGAYFEVFGAGENAPLQLLQSNGSFAITDFDGLQLVGDSPGSVCDFDNDGDCDTDDINALTLAGDLSVGVETGDPGFDAAFDLTSDGMINGQDITLWLAEAATENGFAEPYLLGDTNLDGSVNFDDFVNLNNNWQQSQLPNGDPVAWSFGDLNGDGIVNFDDFVSLNNNWQSTISAAGAAAAVPEPATAAWLAVVGLALWGRCRRR